MTEEKDIPTPEDDWGDLFERGLGNVLKDKEHISPADRDLVPSAVGERNRYTIDREIGRGGMGVVYRGRDTTLERRVAVKILRVGKGSSPTRAQRFLEEAQISAQLAHPGIIPVHDVGVLDDGRPFIVMKLVGGDTFKTRLAQRSSLDSGLDRALRIFLQVCEAIGFAHSRGVIHRDIKTSNVMVGPFGEVYTTDWGLAKVVDGLGTRMQEESFVRTLRDGFDGFESTVGGGIVGTPAYIAPEMARGETRGDTQSDVFCLGGILCEILTGKPPFTGDDMQRAAALSQDGAWEKIYDRLDRSGADPAVIALAKNCLDPDPTKRPQNAAVVASLLADHFADIDARAERLRLDATAERLRSRHERRMRRLIITTSILAVTVVLGGAAALISTERTKNERARETGTAIEAALVRAEELRIRAREEIEGRVDRLGQASAAAREAVRVAKAADAPRDIARRGDRLVEEIDREYLAARAADDVRRRDTAMLERLRTIRAEFPLHYTWRRRRDGLFTALVAYGIDPAGDAVRCAALVEGSAIRSQLIDALDLCAATNRQMRDGDPVLSGRLWDLADAVDDHTGRRKLRNACRERDRESVARMTETLDWDALPAASAVDLATNVAIWIGRERAVEILRSLVRRCPDSYDAHTMLAYCLSDITTGGAVDPESVAHYTAALALCPGSLPVRVNLAYLFADLGQPKRGLEILDECRLDEASDGVKCSVYCARAQMQTMLEDFSAAEKSIAAAIAAEPDSAIAHGRHGRLLVARGKKAEAVDALEKALDIDPLYDYAAVEIVDQLLALGRTDEAAARAEALIARNPSDRASLYAHARCLDAKGKTKDAESIMLNLAERFPTRVEELYYVGQMKARADDFGAALAFWNRILERNPREIKAVVNAAQSLRAIGRPIEAMRMLERAESIGADRKTTGIDIDEVLEACEQEMAIAKDIAAVLDGVTVPKSQNEWRRLFEYCDQLRLDVRSASLWKKMIALTSDRRPLLRAAMCALRAACGASPEAKMLDIEQKKFWRKEGLEWLESAVLDLDRLDSGSGENAGIVAAVARLLDDPAFNGIRSESALDDLEDEAAADADRFRKVWAKLREIRSRLSDG